MRLFSKHRADRILDGIAGPDELPEGDEQVSALLDELRALRAAGDPAREVETVRHMKNAINEDGEREIATRSRLRHATARVAIVVGAVVLVGSATAAVDATPAAVPGITDAPGSVAAAILEQLGIEKRTDEEDAAADAADRLQDAQEREREAAGEDSGEIAGNAPENIPAPARDGIATAKTNAGNATIYTTAVRGWTACVAAAAPNHDPTTGDFDPVKACGAKPTKPAGMGDDEDETESEAAKEDSGPPTRIGPPAGTGPQTPTVPPPTVGPTAGGEAPVTPGPPPGAGPPPDAGPPADTGPPPVVGPGAGGDDDEEEEDEEEEEEEEDEGE